MSFQRKNESLFSSCVTYWQYVVVAINPFLSLTFSQIFNDVTLFFSHSTPNLTTVISVINHINKHLTTSSQNLKYLPVIHVSLALRKAHLNKYYNMTDHSEVYQIAMGECSFPDCFFLFTILLNSPTSMT
jgi:hypothetical protein